MIDFEKQFNEILRETIENTGADVKLTSYSGRFMHGRECLSVQGREGEIELFKKNCIREVVDLMFDIGKDGDDDDMEEIHTFFHSFLDAIFDENQDSMGFGIVVYWPDIPYIDPDEVIPHEDNEDDDDEAA